jgi:hypothetical protein
MNDRTGVLFFVGVAALLAVTFSPSTTHAKPTAEQKCQAEKIRVLALHYLCRQKAEAKAVLKGTAPDYTKCDETVGKALDKLEDKFPLGGPALGCTEDSVHVRSQLLGLARRDAADMACRLKRERLVRRNETGGAILFVDFYMDLNPVLALRHTGNVPVSHARCFYANDNGSCVGSAEFDVDVAAHSEVAWAPSAGSGSIPAVPAGMTEGFLVCTEIDDSGLPIAGNRLIISVSDDERCAQDGIHIRGLPDPVAIFNSHLCLGAAPSSDCPNGPEYEVCPYHPDGTGTPLKPLIEGCWNTISSFTFHCQ